MSASSPCPPIVASFLARLEGVEAGADPDVFLPEMRRMLAESDALNAYLEEHADVACRFAVLDDPAPDSPGIPVRGVVDSLEADDALALAREEVAEALAYLAETGGSMDRAWAASQAAASLRIAALAADRVEQLALSEDADAQVAS